MNYAAKNENIQMQIIHNEAKLRKLLDLVAFILC